MTAALMPLSDSDVSPELPSRPSSKITVSAPDQAMHNPAISSLAATPTGLTIVGDDDSEEEENEEEELKPYFFPPLWLARRTSCLDVLRKEGIRSVVDLGCGPGALLQILSVPANHLDDFPALYPPSPYSTSPTSTNGSYSEQSHTLGARASTHAKLDKLRSVPRLDPAENELHLRRIVGVDINRESLEHALRITEPTKPKAEDPLEENPWGAHDRERWEPLQVEIWEGSLTTHNEAFDDIECMIASEVIEHLPPSLLPKFAPMVLGNYGPRLVIVTTPNHEFNPYFVASSREEESLHRFSDPTERTQRIFRDDDHQFEWTQAEFQSWAKSAAEEHGYKVTFTGCGSLRQYFGSHPIPFPPPSLAAHPALKDAPASLAVPKDPATFFATQIAIFHRQYPNEPERSPRSHRTTPLPFFSPIPSPLSATPDTSTSPTSTPTTTNPPSPTTPKRASKPLLNRTKSVVVNAPHVLVKSHTHAADPAANMAASSEVILEYLEKLFDDYFAAGRANLRDIWNRSEIRKLCGGLIGSVVDAVVEDETGQWDLEVSTGATVDGGQERRGDLATDLVWRGWVAKPPKIEELREDEVSMSEDEDDGPVAANGDEWDKEEVEAWRGEEQRTGW